MNIIPSTGKWKDISSILNDNFALLGIRLSRLSDLALYDKGRFKSSQELMEAHPSPMEGSYAYIGEKSPYNIYLYTKDKGWYDSGEKGEMTGINPDEFIVQTEGDAIDKVMSQKAVTESISSSVSTALSNIKPIINNGTINNAPDEEDLTSDNNVLKFKDRLFGNGLGYIILRSDKTFEEQTTKTNTIYEIRYDFDLNGEDIEIPDGCILKFTGGKLMNGGLTGDYQIVSSSNVDKNFFNVNITGAILSNKDCFIINNAKWGISSDGTNSVSTTDGLNRAFTFASQIGFSKVQLQKGTYLVHANADSEIFNESLVLHSNTEYDFNGATIIQEPHGKQIGSTILLWQCEDIVVRNGIIVGDRETHDYSEEGTHENVIGINIWSGNRITIQDMVVRSCTGDCILVAGTGSINGFNPNEGAKNVLISNCDLSDARRQGISICNAFDCTVDNCIIHGIGLNPYSDGDPRNGTAPRSAIDIEPWNEIFIAELVMRTNITNCKFENNWRHIIEAGPYSYDTKVDSCVFKSETPDKVEYASDIKGGYSGTNRIPDLRESYKNKFPVDIFWDNVNTTVTKCVFINSTLSTVKVAESCIFSGDYNAISVGSNATMIVENCTFEGMTLTGGSGIAKVLNSTINSIVFSQCNLELYDCDVADIKKHNTLLRTFNTTLRKVRYSLTGEHFGSSVVFDELSGDYMSYANTIFKACKIVFKSFAHTLSPNYYSVFDSCDINFEFAGQAISTSNENSKFINNRVTVSHDNSSYKNQIVAMSNGIVLSNIVINEIEKASPVNTFRAARVIKNNTYIGDNLVNENVGDWSEILGTVNEELDAI